MNEKIPTLSESDLATIDLAVSMIEVIIGKGLATGKELDHVLSHMRDERTKMSKPITAGILEHVRQRAVQRGDTQKLIIDKPQGSA